MLNKLIKDGEVFELNNLLQWEMIKMAIARHDDIYDFRGVVGNVEKTHP